MATPTSKLKQHKVLDEASLIQLSRKLGREYVLELHGWSVEEYFDLAPEDRICDYIDGKVYVASPAVPMHQDIVLFVTRILASICEEGEMGRVYNGPATVKVGDSYPEPDIFFIRKENERFIRERYVDCAPDFVVEVVSASTRRRDLGDKLAKYQEAGVPEYWAIDYLRGEVLLWRKQAAEYTSVTLKSGPLTSSAVPGFQIDVDWLWQRPLPRISDLPTHRERAQA